MADPRIGEIKRVLNRYLPEEEHFDVSSNAFTEDEFARFQSLLRELQNVDGLEISGPRDGTYQAGQAQALIDHLDAILDARPDGLGAALGSNRNALSAGFGSERLREMGAPEIFVENPQLFVQLVDTDLPSILDELDGLANDNLLTTETPEQREVRLEGVRAEWQAQEERMAALEGYLFDNGHFAVEVEVETSPESQAPEADPRVATLKGMLNEYLPAAEQMNVAAEAGQIFSDTEFEQGRALIQSLQAMAGIDPADGVYQQGQAEIIQEALADSVAPIREMLDEGGAVGAGAARILLQRRNEDNNPDNDIPEVFAEDPRKLITFVDSDIAEIGSLLDSLTQDGVLAPYYEGVPTVQTEYVTVTEEERRSEFVREVPTTAEIEDLPEDQLEAGLQVPPATLVAIHRAASEFLDEAGIDPERGNDNFLTPERVEALRGTEGFDEFYTMLEPLIEAELYTDPDQDREHSRVIEAELERLREHIHIDGQIVRDNQISDDERMMAWLLINLAGENSLGLDFDVSALAEAMGNHSQIGDNPFRFHEMRMGERRLLEMVGQSDNPGFESNMSGWSVIFTGVSLSQLMGESDGAAPTSYEDLASQELYDAVLRVYDQAAEALAAGQGTDADELVAHYLDYALGTDPAFAELNALLSLPSFASRKDDLVHLITVTGRDGLDLAGFQERLMPSSFIAEYGGMDNSSVRQYSRYQPASFEVPDVVLETLGVERQELLEAYSGRSYIGGPLVMEGADGVTYLVDVDVTTGIMVPYTLDETNDAGETMRDVYDRYTETYGTPMSFEARDELYLELRGFDVFNFYATGGVGGDDTSLGYYSFGHAGGIEQSLNALYYRASGDYLNRELPARQDRPLAEVFNPPNLSVDAQRDVAADVLGRLGILDRFAALDVDVLDDPARLDALSLQYRQLTESAENSMGWREFMITRQDGVNYLVFGRGHQEVVVLELPDDYAATGLLQGLPQDSVNVLGGDGRLRLTSSLPVSQAFVDAVQDRNERLRDELWARHHVEHDRTPLHDALERSGDVVVVTDHQNEDIAALRAAFRPEEDELLVQNINGRSYVALYLDEGDGGGVAVLDVTDNINAATNPERGLDLSVYGAVRELEPVATETQSPEIAHEQTITPP